jgi:hypothetical protein
MPVNPDKLVSGAIIKNDMVIVYYACVIDPGVEEIA